MTSVLQDLLRVEKYIVEFYNPVSHMLHSAVTVETTARDAVTAAIRQVADEYREDVSRHRAAIKHASTGHGVAGVENIATKAQLKAQVEALMRQIGALEEDGSTTDYQAQVASTLPNPNPHVAAPTVFNAGVTTDVKPPPVGSFLSGEPVASPQPSGGLSQSDIDAAVSKRQAEAGPAV